MAQFAATVPRIAGRTFLVTAVDGGDAPATRQDALDGHLEYVEKNCDRYVCCGPIHREGGGLKGSFFVVTAEDADDARRFLEGDPYIASGMYASIVVDEVTVAGGSLMGGVIWESADSLRGKAS